MAERSIKVSFGGSAAGVTRASAQAEKAVESFTAKAARISRAVAPTAAFGVALASAAAYAVAFGASVSGAAGAVALLPAFLAAAALQAAALRAATAGMGAAWQATGKQVRGGGQAVADTSRQVAAAQRQVESATKSLATAQRDALAAQRAVTRARAEEAERLQDLDRSVNGARIARERAARDVTKAEQDLIAATESGDAGAIIDANLAWQDARQTLEEVADRYGDLQQEQAKGQRDGVDGSDAVTDALERQREAQERVTESARQLADAQRAVAEAGRTAAAGGIAPAAEALNKLAPSGRSVIRTLRALGPGWAAAARGAQQETWRGVSGDLRDLSGIYLPRATGWLGRMGRAFNVALRDVAAWGKTAETGRDVDQVLANTASTTEVLAGWIRPIVNGMLRWAAVGSAFLPGLAAGGLSVAERFERWSTAMADSGRAAAWISTALDVTRQLGRIVGNVVASFVAFFRAGDDGGSTIDSLERGSAAMRAWLESSEGQQQVSAGLEKLRSILTGVGQIIPVVTGNAGAFRDTMNVTGAVVGFAADHLDTLAKLLPVIAAGYVISKVAQTGANVAAVVSLPLKAAEVAANWGMRAALQAQTAALLQNTAATRIAAGATAADTAATNVGILARGRAVVSTVAQRVATVAVTAATRAYAAGQWLLNAALTANPVGLVIVGIVALVAAIVLAYKRSETFRAIVDGAFKAIATSATWLWQKGIKPAFDAIVTGTRWVIDAAGSVVSYLRDLPGKIKSAFSTVTEIVSAPFRAAFNRVSDLWNGTVGRLRFQAPDWVPGIGGRGFSLPQLPRLAAGGRAHPGRSYLVGERGPEVWTPDSVGTMTPNHHLGGPEVVELHVDLGEGIRQVVRINLRDHDRRLKRRVTAGAAA
ncbi:hypothetical protein ACIBF5_09490 [Micromonospora sp. NPDC050417]|uniref:hypothetical protein n=1 Tax=Micromonospora sp. NPDC050417 TaxID=3364280 RepID=UPI0037AC5A38